MSDSAPEKIVYFVRHGESINNAKSEYSRLDSPLSDLGMWQAEQIGLRAKDIKFQGLICSPLKRSKQTCEPITRATKLEPVYSDLFVERIKPKDLEGKSHSDSEANKLYKEWSKSLYAAGLRVGDGEDYDDLVLRADAALHFLLNRSESSLLVVTHQHFLKTIVARVLLGKSLTGETFHAFELNTEIENTGISVIKYGKRLGGDAWHLWTYNDHAHLS